MYRSGCLLWMIPVKEIPDASCYLTTSWTYTEDISWTAKPNSPSYEKIAGSPDGREVLFGGPTHSVKPGPMCAYEDQNCMCPDHGLIRYGTSNSQADARFGSSSVSVVSLYVTFVISCKLCTQETHVKFAMK